VAPESGSAFQMENFGKNFLETENFRKNFRKNENFRAKLSRKRKFLRKLSRKRKFSQLFLSFFREKRTKIFAKFSRKYENDYFRTCYKNAFFTKPLNPTTGLLEKYTSFQKTLLKNLHLNEEQEKDID
jgi:hypothetical protein